MPTGYEVQMYRHSRYVEGCSAAERVLVAGASQAEDAARGSAGEAPPARFTERRERLENILWPERKTQDGDA